METKRRELWELKQKQALPLSIKIRLTEERIRQWVDEFGEDGVYVSFSGGKDSTVLLDIVRNRCGYKDIPAVFVDVPTQYPELKAFVKTFDNIVILKPKIGFAEVCKTYGFPLISKEVADTVAGARRFCESVEQAKNSPGGKKITYAYAIADLLGIERRDKKTGRLDFEALKNGDIPNIKNAPRRYKMLVGKLEHKERGVETNEYSQMFDRSRWNFMLDAPFEISNKCCDVMKKNPVHKYAKETGRMPMTAQMAEESRLRQSNWLKHGCNGFDMKRPISNPMSFWLENDVLQYIHDNNLPICSVYGDVVEDFGEQLEGQMDLSDMGLCEPEKKYKTTGCKRTGCMLCGFGCHLEEPGGGRFERLKETHPKMYKMLDLVENNGVTFREAVEWVNDHGGLNIKI